MCVWVPACLCIDKDTYRLIGTCIYLHIRQVWNKPTQKDKMYHLITICLWLQVWVWVCSSLSLNIHACLVFLAIWIWVCRISVCIFIFNQPFTYEFILPSRTCAESSNKTLVPVYYNDLCCLELQGSSYYFYFLLHDFSLWSYTDIIWQVIQSSLHVFCLWYLDEDKRK